MIEGGIVEVKNNKIIVLAENALRKEELDKDDLRRRWMPWPLKKSASGPKERLEIQLIR